MRIISNLMDYFSSDLARQQITDILNSFDSLKCKENNAVKLICCEPTCLYSSLHCQNNGCKACYKRHSLCTTTLLSKWSAIIKQKIQKSNEVIIRLLELQQRIIKRMVQMRRESVKITYFGWVQGEYSDIFTKTFIDKNVSQLRGKEARKISQIMQANQKQKQFMLNQTFEKFFSEAEKVIEQYQHLKSQSINLLLGGFPIQSKIINNPVEQNLLKQWLKSPSKIQLIFRASQNEFKTSKFHKVCDNIPHTLVVAQTQFNKKIGGYTPLTWNSAQGYSKDITEGSFIFSLDLKQKMSLLNKQKAIFCDSSYGPTFNGCDFCLSDEYKKASYNYKSQYKTGQQSQKAFCGVSSGSKFKVLEYQVFRVIWKQ